MGVKALLTSCIVLERSSNQDNSNNTKKKLSLKARGSHTRLPNATTPLACWHVYIR
jgi:hypothetical protein